MLRTMDGCGLDGADVYKVQSIPLSEEVAQNVESAKTVAFIDAERVYLHRAGTFNEKLAK